MEGETWGESGGGWMAGWKADEGEWMGDVETHFAAWVRSPCATWLFFKYNAGLAHYGFLPRYYHNCTPYHHIKVLLQHMISKNMDKTLLKGNIYTWRKHDECSVIPIVLFFVLIKALMFNQYIYFTLWDFIIVMCLSTKLQAWNCSKKEANIIFTSSY